ncbi:DUF2703 domain-containing protein [uncultured Ruminococcus sp.]|uniref:DUF2703 domain-containing protein n=1 Tax=uncultured Ruminococcus sp. TaxID=165186 RepID=UPI002625A2A7|nr:DUF2703 domain-containing protein [uncultured Ruminococcus sp.]
MSISNAKQNCSCSSGNSEKRRILIEYLFLDLNTCDRCIGTDSVLEKAIEGIRPALELAGYTIDYQKIEVSTEQLAKQHCFLSSPIIRVNGHDICKTVSESNCGCCGEIAGTNIDCRVFEYDGRTYEIPTEEMLADMILQSVYNKSACECSEYILPENLKRFYDGRNHKNHSSCSCGCNGAEGSNCNG